jgi:hypothetical protein
MSYIDSDFVASAHNSIQPCQLQDTVAMLQQVSKGRDLIQSHAAREAKRAPTTHTPYDHYKQRVSSYEWKPDPARYSQVLVNSHWVIRAGAILPLPRSSAIGIYTGWRSLLRRSVMFIESGVALFPSSVRSGILPKDVAT